MGFFDKPSWVAKQKSPKDPARFSYGVRGKNIRLEGDSNFFDRSGYRKLAQKALERSLDPGDEFEKRTGIKCKPGTVMNAAGEDTGRDCIPCDEKSYTVTFGPEIPLQPDDKSMHFKEGEPIQVPTAWHKDQAKTWPIAEKKKGHDEKKRHIYHQVREGKIRQYIVRDTDLDNRLRAWAGRAAENLEKAPITRKNISRDIAKLKNGIINSPDWFWEDGIREWLDPKETVKCCKDKCTLTQDAGGGTRDHPDWVVDEYTTWVGNKWEMGVEDSMQRAWRPVAVCIKGKFSCEEPKDRYIPPLKSSPVYVIYPPLGSPWWLRTKYGKWVGPDQRDVRWFGSFSNGNPPESLWADVVSGGRDCKCAGNCSCEKEHARDVMSTAALLDWAAPISDQDGFWGVASLYTALRESQTPSAVATAKAISRNMKAVEF